MYTLDMNEVTASMECIFTIIVKYFNELKKRDLISTFRSLIEDNKSEVEDENIDWSPLFCFNHDNIHDMEDALVLEKSLLCYKYTSYIAKLTNQPISLLE